MGAFDYIMTLVAVVIGLALTHLMQGVGRILENPRKAKIWWVHLLWVAQMSLITVFWWWFQFQLRLTPEWTFQLYAFVLGYAFLIYLICTLLFPADLGDHPDFKHYFLSRRRWFFGMLGTLLVIDVFDTLSKGRAHFESLGLEYPVMQTALVIVCIVGMITPRPRVQAVLVVLTIGYSLLRILRYFYVAA